MRKLYYQVQVHKWELILVGVLSIINFLVVVPVYSCEKCLSTLSLTIGIGWLVYLLCKDYRKKRNIPMIYLLGIVEIACVNFWNSDDVIFPAVCLLIRGILFLIVVVSGVVAIWLIKTRLRKNFFRYLIISLSMVIVGFAGIYGSLYSVYFPYGYEALEIAQGMSWGQVVMPCDFIYYSTDTLFGTDISDVSIRYVDYLELQNSDNIMSKHVDKYEGGKIVTQIAKFLSISESILFIIYISIIVVGVEGKDGQTAGPEERTRKRQNETKRPKVRLLQKKR